MEPINYYKQFEVFSVNATVICPNTSTAMPVFRDVPHRYSATISWTHHDKMQLRVSMYRESVICHFSNGIEGPTSLTYALDKKYLCMSHTTQRIVFDKRCAKKSHRPRLNNVQSLHIDRALQLIGRSLHDAVLRRWKSLGVHEWQVRVTSSVTWRAYQQLSVDVAVADNHNSLL